MPLIIPFGVGLIHGMAGVLLPLVPGMFLLKVAGKAEAFPMQSVVLSIVLNAAVLALFVISRRTFATRDRFIGYSKNLWMLVTVLPFGGGVVTALLVLYAKSAG